MSKKNRIVFLYNGYDTLGMIKEVDYMVWLIDLGIKESVIDNATFYDKGYNFFRYCIDKSMDEDNIVDLVRYMVENNINDSRDFDADMWNNFMQEYNLEKSEVRDLLEFEDDCINIPDLMDFIKTYNNIVICGGGINQCLKEVEIALKALGMPYDTEEKYTY